MTVKDRFGAAVRWLLVPWSQLALALALVGAAAAPALLVAAADVWRQAAGDEVAERLVAELDTADAGLTVVTNSVFEAATSARTDVLVSERISRIDGLAEPTRTLWTLRARGIVGPDGAPASVPLRVIAREGVLDALTVVESSADLTGGVWVSDWFADRTGVGVGDWLAFESAPEPEEAAAEVTSTGGPPGLWPVVGIYRALWSDATHGAYWEQAPPQLVPRFLDVFNGPAFSLLILAEDTMADSGLTGFTQWDAPATTLPASFAQLRSAAAQYRALETDLVQDPEIAPALVDLARIRAPAPIITTQLVDTRLAAEDAVGELEQPLSSARIAGVLIGLAVMVSGAVFAVRQRRTEFRLLAGEGDRWPRMSLRAAAQLAAPVVVGTAVGVVLGVFAAVWVGPATEPAFGVVDMNVVATVALVGLVLTALTTGILGQQTLDTGIIGAHRGGAALAVTAVALGTTALLWYQVGQPTAAGAAAVDLSVVALPMVALVAAVAVVTIILQILTSRARFVGSRLPTPLFLAWRRATGNDVGTQLVTGALAVGLGLVALSIVLVGSLERNTEVKLVAEIGAETRAELLVRPPADLELPPDTSLLSYDPARLTPGDRPVRVLAIDPASFIDAVEWPAEFGDDPAEVLALLDKDVGDDLPVVVVAGGGIPATGAFGVQRFPYTVVGEVRSAPLVTEFGATLLVSAERLDRFALERIAGQMGTTPDDPDVQERYRAPTLGHRQNLVSRLPADTLVEFLEANEMNWREITMRSSRANSVDFLAPQFAFDYLRMLGFVAALAAGAALLLHLASRRSERALAATMTGRMGLSASGSALVTVIEVVTLSLIALLTALAVAPVVTNRLLPRFDPAPLLPPAAAIQAPVIPLALGFTAVIAVAALAVWLVEALTARRDRGRLLRGLD